MKTKLFLIAIALFFVSASLRADVSIGNFWLNPTFEALNLAGDTPDFWNRGGSENPAGSINQVSTANSVSATHSLASIDNSGFYGEWYSDQSLTGFANPGDTIGLHWHEIYSVAPVGANPGEFRVTVRFGFNDGTNTVFGGDNHFTVNGDSAGWTGSLATSPFVVRNQQLVVPAGQNTLRIQLVSGGAEIGTGQYIIDDLSVAVVVPEPSTIALLSVGGLVGLSVLLRRRKIAR